MVSHLRPFPLICSALLLLALCPMPYGYYTFLRIVITIWGATTAYQHLNINPGHLGGLLAAGIAILYNPIIQIHLTRPIWMGINLATILIILLIPHNQIKNLNTPSK